MPEKSQILAMVRKRVDAGDPMAIYDLGTKYDFGDYGLVKDMTRAVELYERAADLGMNEAHHNLGVLYANGKEVAKDMAKAFHHYEAAAMSGHVSARYILGAMEGKAGNYDLALQHMMISAKLGCEDSLGMIKAAFMEGLATKADYASALRGYQNAIEEMSSPDRDEAKACSAGAGSSMTIETSNMARRELLDMMMDSEHGGSSVGSDPRRQRRGRRQPPSASRWSGDRDEEAGQEQGRRAGPRHGGRDAQEKTARRRAAHREGRPGRPRRRGAFGRGRPPPHGGGKRDSNDDEGTPRLGPRDDVRGGGGCSRPAGRKGGTRRVDARGQAPPGRGGGPRDDGGGRPTRRRARHDDGDERGPPRHGAGGREAGGEGRDPERRAGLAARPGEVPGGLAGRGRRGTAVRRGGRVELKARGAEKNREERSNKIKGQLSGV
ncbi:hypothetical protein THAOC_24327 [Thalassiosira oceanica]|uniref:Uncharacterized protein n=1 Tax=Thalassiosira oceanica TaxID=159749 RepID=K0SAV2_THAOC|nr:hypothetical protein THAOC_24327 [Thalassiosira oceanica]|eukprot:EJK55882.1 hypothetical protein THAOC_24327 [Thalassiosira oceanica]